MVNLGSRKSSLAMKWPQFLKYVFSCFVFAASFSPPKLKLNVTEQSIVVRIRAPRTPQRRANGGHIPVTKYQRLNFRIYLMHDNVEQVGARTSSSKLLFFSFSLRHGQHLSLDSAKRNLITIVYGVYSCIPAKPAILLHCYI